MSNGKSLREEQDRLLAELGRIHQEWLDGHYDSAPFDRADSDPHDKETGESDYNIHYPDRSGTWEQEADFQSKAAHVFDQLEMLQHGETEASSAEKLSKVSPDTEFNLAVNGNIVQMLVKSDLNEGSMSYRENGEWVEIKPGEDLPALDDSDLLEVIGDATEIWDAHEGEELTTDEFKSVALDV